MEDLRKLARHIYFEVRFWRSNLFGQTYKTTKCGHKTKMWGRVKGIGIIQLSLIDGQIEYCHQCISTMTIRCAWCGKPILIGDPITLYPPTEDYKIPEYAVIYGKEPLQLVGCLRWNCADTGGDRAGFWVPPGKVHRVLSPIEQVMLTGESIMVSDLCDVKEASEVIAKADVFIKQ